MHSSLRYHKNLPTVLALWLAVNKIGERFEEWIEISSVKENIHMELLSIFVSKYNQLRFKNLGQEKNPKSRVSSCIDIHG